VRARSPAYKASMIRKPSRLISCSQAGPLAGAFTGERRHDSIIPKLGRLRSRNEMGDFNRNAGRKKWPQPLARGEMFDEDRGHARTVAIGVLPFLGYLLDRGVRQSTIRGSLGFNRRKLEDQRREAAEKKAAARRATDAQVLEDAERLIAAWNERQALRAPMIFSPTIGAAIRAG
jgi:hypothetical protein